MTPTEPQPDKEFVRPRGRVRKDKKKENSVESHFVKRTKELGGLCWKFTASSLSGVPDRILILNGRVSFIEVKRPGKKPEHHQRVVISILRRQGIIADYVDSKEAVDALLKTIMEMPPVPRESLLTPVLPEQQHSS